MATSNEGLSDHSTHLLPLRRYFATLKIFRWCRRCRAEMPIENYNDPRATHGSGSGDQGLRREDAGIVDNAFDSMPVEGNGRVDGESDHSGDRGARKNLYIR